MKPMDRFTALVLLVDEVPVAQVVPLHDQPRGGEVDLVEHEGHQHHDHQQAATQRHRR